MNKPTAPMSSPQERETALFALALEKPPGERAAFLDAVTGSDRELRQRLEVLLAAHDAGDHIPEPKSPGTIKLQFEDIPDERIGSRIGRYKLLEKVGEGGCGVVYVAEQTEPVRRRVALKVIKLGMDTKSVVARFEAERQALAMMDHPNIAKVLDAGATELGRPFFVMELVRGIRITDYCDQNNLSTTARLALFTKVCHAIQHAHQKGIIHRDIKPSNILVTLHDGVPVPKVIDFGISKATEGRLTDATVYTQLHQFIGTPAYMSPEQAEMSGLDIDTRSDIYSLGVLLYELLTGTTPFDPNELMSQGIDVMRRTIREKEPVRPSTRIATLQGEERTATAKRHAVELPRLVHQLQGDLDWIVMKCLEKDRTRRYETANGLAADLKRHLAHEPVVARPPSMGYRLQKGIRRNKLVFASAAAVLSAAIFASAFSGYAYFRERTARMGETRERETADAQRKLARAAEAEATAQRDIAQGRLLDAIIREMNSIAASQEFGYRDVLTERVRQALELRGADQRRDEIRSEFTKSLGDPIAFMPTPIPYRSTNSTMGIVALSPDGKLLANWADDVGLELRELPTDKTVALLKDAPIIRELAFSPDARRLYYKTPGRELGEWRRGPGSSWAPHPRPTMRVERLFSSVHATFALEQLAPGEYRVVNLETGEPAPAILRMDRAPVPALMAIGISPDGLIAYSSGSSVEIRTLDDSRPVVKLDAPAGIGRLQTTTFSPDGRFLAVVGESGIFVYSAPNFQLVKRSFVYLGANPYGPAFFGDGSLLAVALRQASAIRVLDLERHIEKHIPAPEPVPIILASMDGKTLLRLTRLNMAYLDLEDTPERSRLGGHRGGVPAVEFSPDGKLIASVGKDGGIRLWNADTRKPVRIIERDEGIGQSLAFTSDSKFIAVSDYHTGQFDIFATATGEKVLTAGESLPGGGWRVGFSLENKRLAVMGLRRRVWEVSGLDESGRAAAARLLVDEPASSRNLKFLPDGESFLYTARFGPGNEAVIQTPNGPARRLPIEVPLGGYVQTLDFIPQTGEIVAAELIGERRRAAFYNLETGEKSRVIELFAPGETHRVDLLNLSVRPDGKKLAAGNYTGTRVNIYDIATGRRLYSLPEETGIIWWMAWHPDSQRLAVSRDNGDISIWRLDAVEAAIAEVGLAP